MAPLRPLLLVLVAGCSAAVGWAASLGASANGLPAPVLHWSSLVTMAAGMLITLGFGWRVLRHRQGKLKRRLDPIQAARTVVLAQATAYAGALILGWHGGVVADLAVAGALDTPAAASSLGMMAGAAVMVIVGWTVEQFCKLPPDDPSAPDGRQDNREDNEGYAAGAG